MSAPTRDGHRTRWARDILPRATAEQAAAEVAAQVVALTRKGLDDPAEGWRHISDARALAQILQGLTGYVRMFERGAT